MANDESLKPNGPNQRQENQQESEANERDTQGSKINSSQALKGANNAFRSGRNTFASAKRAAQVAQKTAQSAQKAAQVARAAAVLANPWVLGAIAIAIAILLVYPLFFHNGSGDLDTNTLQNEETVPSGGSGTQPTNSIPGVTINLSGPPTSENGRDIVYEVSVTYDPVVAKVPIENIVLVDTIPTGAIFVGTDGVQAADSTPSIVTWSLKDPENQKPFHITLRPTADDIYIVHTVLPKIIASSTGGGGTSTDSDEFLTLFSGQGRNTSLLGGRSNFITTIITNSSGLPLPGKESYLGAIYDAGVKYNVNPLIIAGIWGTESGFNTDSTYPFGCLNPQDTGFTENVTCAAGSLNQLMSSFETRNSNGSLEIPSTIGNTCIYTDPFIYGYEMYTPICHVNDGNASARVNMISFYKKFQGI